MKKERVEELKQSIIDAGRIMRGEIPPSRAFDGDRETGEIVEVDPLAAQRRCAEQYAARLIKTNRKRSRRSAT